MKRVRLIRPVYFIWLIIPVIFYALFFVFGAPHMLFSYSWRDDGQGFDPLAYRYYIRCTYFGPYGPITIHYPRRGECGWFVFRHKAQSEQASTEPIRCNIKGAA